jgi:hypothetical protein
LAKTWESGTQAETLQGSNRDAEKAIALPKIAGVARQRPLVEKESYKWVEALIEVDKQVEANTRVIQIFDREGDIAEVFDQIRQLKHTGVLVRASHNRSLDHNSERLWDTMELLPIRFEQEIDVPGTANRQVYFSASSCTCSCC